MLQKKKRVKSKRYFVIRFMLKMCTYCFPCTFNFKFNWQDCQFPVNTLKYFKGFIKINKESVCLNFQKLLWLHHRYRVSILEILDNQYKLTVWQQVTHLLQSPGTLMHSQYLLLETSGKLIVYNNASYQLGNVKVSILSITGKLNKMPI